jgi:uncharacterized protein (TIGR02246 family)
MSVVVAQSRRIAHGLALIGVAFLALGVAGAKPARGPEAPLRDADRAAIRALDARFVRGWLDDDANAVLGLYSPDAALLPPGAQPLAGPAAIRAYWWPTDGSHTRITAFDRTIDEIEGNGDLAWMRGTARLAWTYEKDGKTTVQTSRSIDLVLLRRGPDDQWRIVRQMWNTLPD